MEPGLTGISLVMDKQKKAYEIEWRGRHPLEGLDDAAHQAYPNETDRFHSS